MKTVADYIQRVKDSFQALSDDTSISKRYIFNIIKSSRSELIKQEAEKKRLWDGFSSQAITCFKVIPVDISECCTTCGDLGTGFQILRSELKLPILIDTIFGKIITGVFDTIGNEIEKTTLKDWNGIRKRKYRLTPKAKFFIRNEYIYLVDIDPNEYEDLTIVIEGLFEEPELVERLNSCTDNPECDSMLEYNFYCPGYLERRIMLLSYDEIARKLGIPKDELNNAKEDLGTTEQK